MENHEVNSLYRVALFVLILSAIGGLAFAAGIAWSTQARASEIAGVEMGEGPSQDGNRSPAAEGQTGGQIEGKKGGQPRVVYPKQTELDFEGLSLEGQVKNPGEFYFQHRAEEKFDSLVKRRKNFHREMLRDAVLSK